MINKALIATTAFVFISIWDDPGEFVLVSLGRTPDLGLFRREKLLAVQPRAREGSGHMLPGLEKPPARSPLAAARPQTRSCDRS